MKLAIQVGTLLLIFNQGAKEQLLSEVEGESFSPTKHRRGDNLRTFR